MAAYGVGYNSKGLYPTKINGVATKEYYLWRGMLERCYSEKYKSKNPSYLECVVSDYFLDYQNFAKFYNDNLWCSDCMLSPDKDILIKGNKLYSPDTVILVDSRINCLFTKRQNDRGKYPIGVYSKNGRYYSQCNDELGRRVCLGYYDTIEEAFFSYKSFKEKVIKNIADEYKEKYINFPNKLYNAMYNYKVEITD